MLYPRGPVPAFEARMLDNDRKWSLAERTPETFNLIIVYRGHHCRACKAYLTALNEKVKSLQDLGIETFVVSAESRDRVQRAKDDWGLSNLVMGYGLDLAMGHAWGLYISDISDIAKFQDISGFQDDGDSGPFRHFEPGLFVVRGDDKTLFYASIQNMPFGRPDLDQLIMGLTIFLERGIEARGNVRLPEPSSLALG